MIAAARQIVYIYENASIWRDLIIAGIPAAVALLVVFIGGQQSRNRLIQQLHEADERWTDQQRFEREKFATQERRVLYAGLIHSQGKLGYDTLEALGHLDDPDKTATSLQTWMTDHNNMTAQINEIRVIGSEEFVAIAEKIDSFWDYWLEPTIDGDQGTRRRNGIQKSQ